MTHSNTELIADLIRQITRHGELPFLTITSSSMAPLFQTGDQVGLETVEPGQLNRGDIVTLTQDDHLLTHRFWGLDDGGRLHTRGDRPLTPDASSSASQLLGRVIVRRRQQRELSLQMGAGRWLNRHLAWLVQVESFLLTGHAPSPITPPLPVEKQRALFVRLVRRAFFIWASLVVTVLTWPASLNQQQEST
ncbi:MAG: S24 family peptidase [Anaerolineae bacterium]